MSQRLTVIGLDNFERRERRKTHFLQTKKTTIVDKPLFIAFDLFIRIEINFEIIAPVH